MINQTLDQKIIWLPSWGFHEAAKQGMEIEKQIRKIFGNSNIIKNVPFIFAGVNIILEVVLCHRDQNTLKYRWLTRKAEYNEYWLLLKTRV